MVLRPHSSPGIAIPGRIRITVVLCLTLATTGCAGQRIRAAKESSTRAFREHLVTVPADAETPEQKRQTAALRARLLHDEWVQRGYRVGNEKGGETILYSAMGKGFLGGIWYFPFQLLGQTIAFNFQDDRPARAARLMEDAGSADARRRGINDLARWDFAQDGPYIRRYRQIAQDDPDPLVRATALRALNRSRDPAARPLFIAALRDPSTEVRLEAAKGLVNLPEPSAAGPLVRVVTSPEEDRDVRIAAAEALRYYKSVEVARALIPRLSERDFGVAWQARRSLKRITGRDLRYDEAAWLGFITGPEKPFG
jgi:hypothetical protein